MPEPKELSTSAALETLRGWSALERERAASAPKIELQRADVKRLMHLWCKARSRVCESDHPNDPIDALLEFGSAAREAGFQPRVDALDGGSDEYRRVAVAFVQLALSGGRELLIQFVRELRVTERGYKALALAHDIVFHEVLPIARPPRVPNGWEGLLPAWEVRTVEDLLAWFDQQLAAAFLLAARPHEPRDSAVLRDARRLMDELHIFCDAARAVGQLSNVEIENQLRDLKALCQGVQNPQNDDEENGESAEGGVPDGQNDDGERDERAPKKAKSRKPGNPMNVLSRAEKTKRKKWLRDWGRVRNRMTFNEFLDTFPKSEREAVRKGVKTAQRWKSEEARAAARR